MATQTERRDSTKQAIIESAMKHFTRSDLSASMESIARDAGVTKGSIHYHFDSRVGLLQACASFTVIELEKRIAETADGSDVTAWVRAFLEEQATPKGRMLVLINDELFLTGELERVDPFPYFTKRFADFDVAAPSVLAAALIQFGRQLAFKTPRTPSIDEVMEEFSVLL